MTKIVEPSGDLNFSRFGELLEDEAGLDRGTGKIVLRAVLNIIARHVAAGYRVKLTNFGSFFERTIKIPHGGLPHRVREGARIPSVVRKARFVSTGIFADAMRNAEPVGTLAKRAKGTAGQ